MAVIYSFKGRLTLDGALHIGSGGGDAQTDATVVRDARGNPYIPGSSLRGAFRAAVERLAPALLGVEASRGEDEAHWRRLSQRIDAARSEADVLKILLDTAALNCLDRLFGSPFWASPLLIPDLQLEGVGPKREYHEIRHGVGIDRDTGAARDQFKYDFEVLPRGYSFAFFMRCEIPDDPQARSFAPTWLRALALGLQLMRRGELPLGGRQARGVGRVLLDDLKVYTLDISPANKGALIDALLKPRDDDARYGSGEDGPAWVEARLNELRGT